MFIAVLLVLALNLAAVRAFGEAEFWFALIKILTILALIVVGIVLIVIGFTAPDGVQASVSNLWAYGGFFPTGFVGFLGGFQIAIFAFTGIELVGTTAAEAKDPEKNLPKAIDQVPIRIVFFYVVALAVIMCVTPWNQAVEDRSPFVALFALTGFGAAAGIINFVVLTSATSAANSGLFASSRIIYGLSTARDAPHVFSRLTRAAVPALALLLSCVCILLGGSLGLVFDNAFELITTVSSILFIFVWAMILLAYLVYRRRRPDLHSASAYKLRGGIWLSWLVLGFFVAVLVILGVFPSTRIPLLVTPIWFIAVGIAYAIVRRRERPAVTADSGEHEQNR